MAQDISKSGAEFGELICNAIGVDYARVRRVVLDAPFDELVTIYVEFVGDDRTLKLDWNTIINNQPVKIVKLNDDAQPGPTP